LGPTQTVEDFFYLTLVISYVAPLLLLGYMRGANDRVIVLTLIPYFLFFFLYNLFFDHLESSLGGQIYYLLYTLVEFFAFTLIIIKSDAALKFKRLCYTLAFLFLIYCTYRYFVKSEERMDSYEIALETCIILFMAIYFFYLRFKKVDEQYLYQNPYFWLMTGMLVYLAFTFFFNILVNHVDNEVIKNYYHFSYIGDIIKNLLFAVAIWHLPRRSGSESRAQSFNAPKLDLI